MKQFLFLLLISISTLLTSQTTSSLERPDLIAEDSIGKSISLYNPYLQSNYKLGYTINSKADFKDNLLFSLKFRKNIYQGNNFILPIVSNVGLGNWINLLDNAALLTDAGLSLGLYPYFVINKGDLVLVPHFEFSTKVIPGESLEKSRKSYKVAGNIELQLTKNDMTKNTFSLGLFYNNTQNMSINNYYGLDFTGLISLDQTSALLIDYKKPFNGLGLLSLGVVIK